MSDRAKLVALVPDFEDPDIDSILQRARGARRKRIAGLAAALVTCAVLAGTVSPFATPFQMNTPGNHATASTRGKPYNLPTHCGIYEVHYADRWYVRQEGRLGTGTPPLGWGDPQQPGYVTIDSDKLVFVDDAGHREVFVERVGATKPLDDRACA